MNVGSNGWGARDVTRLFMRDELPPLCRLCIPRQALLETAEVDRQALAEMHHSGVHCVQCQDMTGTEGKKRGASIAPRRHWRSCGQCKTA